MNVQATGVIGHRPKLLDEMGVRVVAALDIGTGAARVSKWACSLAEAFDCDWEAVHIESPSNASLDEEAAADALSFAASLGATVTKLPAASVAAGLASHLEAVSATDLVIGQTARSRRFFKLPSLVDEINGRLPGVVMHLIPIAGEAPETKSRSPDGGSPADYAYALAAVVLTVGVALVLNRVAGLQYLSFLFFFPVIASAARLGTMPAVVAAVGCSAAFNFFFLDPVLMINLGAVQSWIMSAALILVALYTGAITTNLRARAVLSERSAQENASIANFAAELTRAANWETTAQVICSGIGTLFDVHSLLIREVNGSLSTVASVPAGASLDPLDKTALDWAWSHGEPAGNGTAALSAVNWRFEPLTTSLGRMAVLALARSDGRDPVPAARKLMLSTLLAQSALALERLRLEDLLQAKAQSKGGD